MNADVEGQLKVEILDTDGHPIDGFTADDAIPFHGDKIDQVMRWEQSPDLSKLAGQPIRLRFQLTGGQLYSYQFTN